MNQTFRNNDSLTMVSWSTSEVRTENATPVLRPPNELLVFKLFATLESHTLVVFGPFPIPSPQIPLSRQPTLALFTWLKHAFAIDPTQQTSIAGALTASLSTETTDRDGKNLDHKN